MANPHPELNVGYDGVGLDLLYQIFKAVGGGSTSTSLLSFHRTKSFFLSINPYTYSAAAVWTLNINGLGAVQVLPATNDIATASIRTALMNAVMARIGGIFLKGSFDLITTGGYKFGLYGVPYGVTTLTLNYNGTDYNFNQIATSWNE